MTIGAGSGGVRASRFAAQYYNAKVAVVELPFGFVSSDDVGGAHLGWFGGCKWPLHACTVKGRQMHHSRGSWADPVGHMRTHTTESRRPCRLLHAAAAGTQVLAAHA